MRFHLGPLKTTYQLIPESDDHNPRAQLWNAKIRSIQQPPIRMIAKLLQLILQEKAIVFKNRREKASHIFDHHCPWADFVDQADSSRKKIAFVLVTKLFTGN